MSGPVLLFKGLLLLDLARHCWRLGKKLRQRANMEAPADDPARDDGEMPVQFADPQATDPEQLAIYCALVRLLNQLTPEELTLIVRHHLYGVGVAVIATQLGISETAAKQRLRRARLRLMRRLGDNGWNETELQ